MTDTYPDSLVGFMEEERLFYTPSFGSRPSVETKVLKADFGDGYTQRAANGINSVIDKWELNWKNLESDYAIRIDNFFREKKGYISFLWTPPGETTAKIWSCPKFSGLIPVRGNKIYNYNASLKQEFDFV